MIEKKTKITSKDDLIEYILSNKIINVNPLSDICVQFDDVNNLCRNNEQLVYKMILINIGFVLPLYSVDDTKYDYKLIYKTLHQGDTTKDIINYYNTRTFFKDAISIYNQQSNTLGVFSSGASITVDYIKFILKYSQSNNLCDDILYICKVYNDNANNKLMAIVNYIIDEMIPSTVNKSNIITNIVLQCVDLCDEKTCNISNMIMSLISSYKSDINKSEILTRIIQCDKVKIYEKILNDFIDVKKKIIENIGPAIQCKAYNILNYIKDKIENEYSNYLDQILQQIIDSKNEQQYKFFIDYIFTINYIDHYTTFLQKYIEKQLDANTEKNIPKFIKYSVNNVNSDKNKSHI